jgi:hypothetical protein
MHREREREREGDFVIMAGTVWVRDDEMTGRS